MVVGGLLLLGLTFLAALGAAIVWVFRERVGTSTDLELQGRQDRLESNLKMLRDEWESYRSNLDTIVRRGIRLKVLEGKKEWVPEGDLAHTPTPPLTRAELLKRALGKKEA
jgi:hypothetical protein